MVGWECECGIPWWRRLQRGLQHGFKRRKVGRRTHQRACSIGTGSCSQIVQLLLEILCAHPTGCAQLFLAHVQTAAFSFGGSRPSYLQNLTAVTERPALIGENS